MGSTVKLANDLYLETSSIVHNKEIDLETLLNQLLDKISIQEQEIKKLTPVVLYDNENSTTASTYDLSDSVSNYDKITVYYKQTSYYTRTDKSVEIYNPNNKTIILDENFVLLSYNGNSYNGAYGLHRAFKFNNNTIVLLNECNQKYVGLNGTGTWGIADTISITKVIGYKY